MAESDGVSNGRGSGAGIDPSCDLPLPRAVPAGRLLPEQLESACKLAARGVDTPTIAAVLGEPEKRVERELARRQSKQAIRRLRGRDVLLEIDHEREMRDMLPRARDRIRHGMEHALPKDAAAIGMKLHEALIQKPPQRIEHQIQGTLSHDFSGLIEGLRQSIEAIREVQQGRNPLERVVRGDVGLAQHRPALTAGAEEPKTG